MAKPSPFPLMWDRRARRRTAPPRSGSKLPGLWTQAFMMFGFAVSSNAITLTLRFARGEEHLPPGQADIGNTLAQSIILLGILIYFAGHRRVLYVHARALLPYILILMLCLLSVVWSQYPGLTVRRWFTLASCIFFGLYCSETAGLDGIIRIYGRTAIVLMIMSIVVYFAVPNLGHETAQGYTGAMRGVFAQKNTLGQCAALAIACFAYRLLTKPRAPVATVLALLMMLGCAVMAKAATSLGIAMVIIFVTAALYAMRLRIAPLAVYALIAVAFIAALIAVLDPGLLFALMNRDTSLTGRTQLWQMSLQAAAERPWTGYGYAAFWNESSRTVQYIWLAIGWEAPSAHNTYIDILLVIGIPGLALYLWLWTHVIYVATQAAWRGNAPEATWILLFMLVILALNFDEGGVTGPDQFTAMMPATLIFLWDWRRVNGRRRPHTRLARASREVAGEIPSTV